MDDNVGIAGYYWGTSSSYRFNSFSVSGKEARLSVNTAGIYYVTALDTNGNLSDTQSVTFYKTILNANGGSVSLKSVLTQAGKSFDFPTPTRSGHKYLGWSSYPFDTEGDTSLRPVSSTTYYAIWQAEENAKPTVKLTTTNDVAAKQTVILTMKDSDGISGYYWGTDPDCTKNKYTAYTYNSTGINVTASGTYYAVAVDQKGNLSDAASVTFRKTTLHPNGGSCRVTSVLTKQGNSFELPTPTREGCNYLGWATAPDAAEGIKTLAPTADATYYALWRST
ncbi:MAG: InlB B-repeat-containing protein, partial [Ruminococcus sp.]|nr:InlB B-repeat-containing protein [Ruminococcus sp.]